MLLSDLLLMYAYRCCYFPGFLCCRVDACPTTVEFSSANGDSNVPGVSAIAGFLAVVAFPAFVGFPAIAGVPAC